MYFGCCILLNSMVDYQRLTDFLHVKGEDNKFQGEEVQEQIPLVHLLLLSPVALAPLIREHVE